MRNSRPLILSAFVIFAAGACSSIVSRPVAYAEMPRAPYLQQDKQGNLLINLTNSRRHSALSISRVTADISATKKIVLVRALQSPHGRLKPIFKLDVPPRKIMQYQYYWSDPDGQRHLLAFE